MHVILACLLLCTHGYQENIGCGSVQAVMRMQSNESNNWGRNTDLINWFFSSLWPLINRTGNKVLAIKESTLLKRRLLILGTNCATYSTRQRTQKSLNTTNNRKEPCARRTEQRTTTVTTNTSRKKPLTVVSNGSNCKVTGWIFLLKTRLN